MEEGPQGTGEGGGASVMSVKGGGRVHTRDILKGISTRWCTDNRQRGPLRVWTNVRSELWGIEEKEGGEKREEKGKKIWRRTIFVDYVRLVTW